jgi:hypothetical protein
LKAIEQMPSSEFDAFVSQVVAMQARRGAVTNSARESELLLRSHQALPAERQRRFENLVDRRQSGVISEAELGELIAIADLLERMEADRMDAIVELASLKKTTVSTLLDQLQSRMVHGQGKN